MNTEISRYLVDANGNSFSSDTDLQSLSNNSKVKNTNSGVSYKKVQGTTSEVPVFDKVPFQEGQPDAVLYSPQSLTTAQKQQARTNIGASSHDAVLYDTDQQLTNTQIDKALSNLGISHYRGDKGRFFTRQITFGNTQILYGQSTLMKNEVTSDNVKFATAIYGHPFISAPIVATSGFSSTADSNATCCVISNSSSPRGDLLGSGSPDHISRGFFISIGQRFPLVESAKVGGDEDLTESSRWFIDIPKSLIDTSGTYAYFLVDMFMTSNTSSSDYIEYSGSSDVKYGYTKLSNNSRYVDERYTRDYDLDLSFNPDNVHSNATFAGYADINDRKLFDSSDFNTFIMRSFILEVPVSNIVTYYRISFNHSLTNGAKGRFRVFYIPNNS